jgi:secreted trypsin-like serine protease
MRRLIALVFLLHSCGIEDGIETAALPIVNGTNDDAHPHVVALMKAGRVRCSGTLISESAVLTAGHCVAFDHPTEVHFGAMPTATQAAITRIARVSIHPNYEWGPSHDLAVITLDPPSTLRPAVLAATGMVEKLAGRPVTVVGFGNQSVSQRSSPVRRIGLVTIDAVEATTLTYSPSPSSTCAKDSGGPVFMEHDGREYLVGVVSWGDSLCQGGGVFARADTSEAFIERAVRGEPPDLPTGCMMLPGCHGQQHGAAQSAAFAALFWLVYRRRLRRAA